MKKFLSVLIFVELSMLIYSQEKFARANYGMSGYISALPSIYWNKDTALWQTTIHNRLNFDWYPSQNISGTIQFRNQIFGGNLQNIKSQKSGFKSENYYLPLTYLQNFNDDYLLSLSIDRFWLQYTVNKLEIRVGRQRINWGQSFVWSTNDIFNTYNFFEFDYPERPGVDAIRIQYYISSVSSLELASKIDSSNNISAASLFRFNKWNYDFQIMTGYLQESQLKLKIDSSITFEEGVSRDFTSGVGFSGSIKRISIRGEMSYFYSLRQDPINQLLLSFSTDYTFENLLNLMFEFFYADKIYTQFGSGIMDMYSGNKSVKSQTFTRYNYFGQISYPISPLINFSLSGMYFYDTDISAVYVGPGLDLSLSDNISLSAFLQVFYFNYLNPNTNKKEWNNVNFAFLRGKWNF